MNYYSRNSPVKRKKINLPAGFLLQKPIFHSLQPTPRSRINASLISQPSARPRSQQHSQLDPGEILILDDDTIYAPPNEILIEQDDSDQDLAFLDIRVITEQREEEEDIDDDQAASGGRQQDPTVDQAESGVEPCIQISREGIELSEHRGEQKDSAQEQEGMRENEEEQPIKEVQNKPIFRNYSFGNENQIWDSSSSEHSSVASADRLIYRLIDPRIASQLRTNGSTKHLNYKKSRDRGMRVQAREVRVEEMRQDENWKKMVTSFIKKRQSWKEKKQGSQKEAKDSEENETSERNSESAVAKKEEQPPASDESGYFQEANTDQIPPETTPEVPSPHVINLQPPAVLSENSGFNNSLQLLMETIEELPKSMVPTYLAIHKQLRKKERANKEMLRRQGDTIEMMKVMVAMHERYLHVDDLVLQDFKSGGEEVVAANQEIILSLVRRLASYL